MKNPYTSVLDGDAVSYGGGQQRSDNKVIARCGCGVIAATDTLLYLSRYQPGCSISELGELDLDGPIPSERYYSLVRTLNRRYFPLLYPAGMNGLSLALGMNLVFSRHGVPLRADWGLSRDRLWPRLEEMLRADIPAILSVGPNFPQFWQSHKLSFYVETPGGYRRSVEVKAHYVTATGLDESWIRISSWGSMYYLNRAEYLEYVDRHSSGLLSNILYISRK